MTVTRAGDINIDAIGGSVHIQGTPDIRALLTNSSGSQIIINDRVAISPPEIGALILNQNFREFGSLTITSGASGTLVSRVVTSGKTLFLTDALLISARAGLFRLQINGSVASMAFGLAGDLKTISRRTPIKFTNGTLEVTAENLSPTNDGLFATTLSGWEE